MKKFIAVFLFLVLINAFVPTLYYQVYYKTNLGQLVEKDPPSQKDPLISPTATPSNTSNSTEKFELYNLATQSLDQFDLISFLVGSAACEVPASYEAEAIKAQMIACHSYYLYCKKNGLPSDDLNLSYDERYMQKYASKERLQEFWGMSFDDNYQKFLRCANEVQNSILTYNGEIALTPYYAVSCGKTQPSENEWGMALDYLVSVESANDVISDNYLKVKTYSVQEMYDRFMANFTGFKLNIEKPEEWVGDIIYNEAGYVTSVQVGDAKITGQDFRKYFELPSSCFMIFLEEDQFSIASKGYGHGVGMSQFGANQLSQAGKKYNEILAHYYPKTTLTQKS